MRRSLLAVLLVTSSLAAQAPIARDSAGIRILDYRGLTPTTQVVLSPTATATVGENGTGPTQLLNGVAGAARLSDGRLVIAQSKIIGQHCDGGGCTLNGSLLVALYDSTGKTQSIFGRMGNGPGEISQGIQGLHVFAGDSIVVATQRGAIIVYDGIGKYASQFTLTDQAFHGNPMFTGVTPSGEIVGVSHINGNARPSSTVPEGLNTYRDTLVFKHFDRNGLAGSTGLVVPGDSVSFTHTITKTADGVRYGISSPEVRSLMPAVCWAASICKATGNGNDVAVYRDGRLTQLLRFPPPTATEMRLAAVVVVQGTNGQVWINSTSNGSSRWWIVAADGRLVGTCDLGKARLFQVGRDFVVTLRYNTDGVEVVEVRRLK